MQNFTADRTTVRQTKTKRKHQRRKRKNKVSKKVSIKEQVVDFKPQPVITKDNVDEAEFWGNFDLEDGYWSETANTWNTYAIE